MTDSNTKMKVLSLEEIESFELGQDVEWITDEGDIETREYECLLHTAREYHRLREALNRIINHEFSYMTHADIDCDYSEAYFDSLKIARGALKESEGE